MHIYTCQIGQGCKLTSKIHVWKLLTHWAVSYCTNKFVPVTFCLPVAQGREAISHNTISKEQLWTQFYADGQKKKVSSR